MSETNTGSTIEQPPPTALPQKESGSDGDLTITNGEEKRSSSSTVGPIERSNSENKKKTKSKSRPLGREVVPMAGKKTGYLKQLASNLPSNVDEYLPEFVKTYVAGQNGSKIESDPREIIYSASFQYVTFFLRDPSSGNCRAGKESLLLVLGYVDGFQVYDITDDSSPAQEILSARGTGGVWICKFLTDPAKHLYPVPEDASTEQIELHKQQRRFNLMRPLMATVSVEQERTVRIYSLKTHKTVHQLHLDSKVLNIESNERVVAVALEDKIIGYNAHMLQQKFVVPCYASSFGAMSLGSRWLAFAGTEPVPGGAMKEGESDSYSHGSALSSKGTRKEDENQWASTVSSAAKDLAAGLLYLGEKGYQKIEERRNGSSSAWQKGLEETNVHITSVNDSDRGDSPFASSPPTRTASKDYSSGVGSIVVRDLVSGTTVAHFQSHQSPLALLQFDPSGALLVSCSSGGQTIYVHRILPHVMNDREKINLAPCHQVLYRLSRGITRAAIRHVSFSGDLRWLTVTSARGTTHVFPISPNGGASNTLTHSIAPMASSPSSNDEGWHLRERFASISSSFTGTSPPRSAPSSLSTSLGSATSLPSFMDQNKSNRGRPILKPSNIRVLPMVIPDTPTSGCVHLSALARVRQKLRNPLFDSVEHPNGLSTINDHEHVPVPVCAVLRGSFICLMSSSGILEQYELQPTCSNRDRRELALEVNPARCWDVCRRMTWPECKPSISACKIFPSASKSVPGSERQADTADKKRASWLSNVEIHTHAAPITHVWAAPQFRFSTYDDGLIDSSHEMGSVAQVFVERQSTTTIAVRGAGPTPVFTSDSKARDEDDAQSLGGLRSAIETPAHFHNLYIPDDQEIDQHVLVFDDDMDDEGTQLGRLVDSVDLTGENFVLDEEEGFLFPNYTPAE